MEKKEEMSNNEAQQFLSGHDIWFTKHAYCCGADDSATPKTDGRRSQLYSNYFHSNY